MVEKLFEIRGLLNKKTGTVIAVTGFIVLMSVWIFITQFHLIGKQILPSPISVITCIPELHFKNSLVRNLSYSVYLNFMGYIEAVVVSLVVGFLMGLFPLFKSLFSQYVNATRFLPMTAMMGLFIAWFGIESNMKIQFLAIGIMVYLIPVVIQRIVEVEEVYDHTSITLGATYWQRILHVYFPYVMCRIINDIQNLLAISWTYLIFTEMVNSGRGGIGALAYLCARQSRVDKVFAVLLVILLVGFIQDKIFDFIDRKFFPFKYL